MCKISDSGDFNSVRKVHSKRSTLGKFNMSLLALTVLASASVTAFAANLSAGSNPGQIRVDPQTYPKLDSIQLGHINRVVQLARQADGDWSAMGSWEPSQYGYDSYRYQLAFMDYALALANNHYTPAYRDIYSDSSLRLIRKMLRPDVWSYWETASRMDEEGNLVGEGMGIADPIADQNIMYSGHLLQMILTHELIYGDSGYSKANSIEFPLDPTHKSDYDIDSAVKVVFDQFKANDWKGVACEPHTIYIECNGHPIVAFKVYDEMKGTDLYKQTIKGFKEQYAALGYLDTKTLSYMRRHRLNTGETQYLDNPEAYNDGWAGVIVNAWWPEEAKRLYPAQEKRHIQKLDDGTLTIKVHGKGIGPVQPFNGYSYDHGFAVAYAAEMGDIKTRDGLLAYAQKYWNPKWDGDALVYKRNDNDRNPDDGKDVWRQVSLLTANALLPFAQLNEGNALADLYDLPYDRKRFEQPYLTNVAFPAVQVSRAIYDPKNTSLIVSLVPGKEFAGGKTAWDVKNIDLKASYTLWGDGKKLAVIKEGRVDNLAKGDAIVELGADALHVSHALAAERSFVLAKDGVAQALSAR